MNISILKGFWSRLDLRKDQCIEALGIFTIGLGLYLGLALCTFSPLDYQPSLQRDIMNAAGPLGALISGHLFGALGIVALVGPFCLVVWGLFLVFGNAEIPRVGKIIAFSFLILFTAAVFEIELGRLNAARPSFGFGGSLGALLGNTLTAQLGHLGALLILTVLAFVSLVLTGIFTIGHAISQTRYSLIRGVENLKKIMASSGDLKDEDQLIREALSREARKSKTANRNPEVSAEKLATSANSKRKKENAAEDDTSLVSETGGEQQEAELSFFYSGEPHGKASANIFSRSSRIKSRKAQFDVLAERLTQQLAQFKVEGKVKRIVEGPVVTTYEFEPVAGTKLSKVTALSQDLARLLQAKSLRILAPIPGKKVCGFEVPNEERQKIGFADLAEHKDLKSGSIELPIAMGVDVTGRPIIEDLAKMPHLLVAGSTGSGKSVFMNSLIASLVCRHSAKDLRFIMVDPKMVELVVFNKLPHMICPVVSDPAVDAKSKLDALVAEMELRFKRMQILGARNLQSFNEIIRKRRKTEFPEWKEKWQTLPYIVLVIDELADMMMVLGKDVEVPITRLAQKARAAGIHLVIATQRPSADVVTGLIKANFPTRVAFRVLSGLDSRTILDQNGAEALVGQGDMLYLNSGGLRRLHGAYLSEEEVQKMVKAVKTR